MTRLAPLLIAAVLIGGCAQSRVGRHDAHIHAAVSFLEAAKADRVAAVQQFASPGAAPRLTDFLLAHIADIGLGACYVSRVIDSTDNVIILRVECYRQFTDTERTAEDQRVRGTCLARAPGVFLAVYEFAVTEDKHVFQANSVGSLWERPNTASQGTLEDSRP